MPEETHEINGLATLQLCTDPLGVFSETSDGRKYFAPLTHENAEALGLALLAHKRTGVSVQTVDEFIERMIRLRLGNERPPN